MPLLERTKRNDRNKERANTANVNTRETYRIALDDRRGIRASARAATSGKKTISDRKLKFILELTSDQRYESYKYYSKNSDYAV